MQWVNIYRKHPFDRRIHAKKPYVPRGKRPPKPFSIKDIQKYLICEKGLSIEEAAIEAIKILKQRGFRGAPD